MWKTAKPCGDCPFSSSKAGVHLRKSLKPERWRKIKAGLLQQEHFYCHKTTDETGNGTNLVCAGSIDWQDKHGVSSQYVRICERLDYANRKKTAEFN